MNSSNFIKVIGIGRGGAIMVNHMYNMGIYGVDFAVCHTDEQSFNGVDVPEKVGFGHGLNSRWDIDKVKNEFENNAGKFENLLTDNTQMVFIVAGMGGYTGSGVAPLLAKMAKSKGILTVGIATTPFLFEGLTRLLQSFDAVEEMYKNTDALIVIKNERLKTLFPDSFMDESFIKANEIVYMTVKSIAEIIMQKGVINRDFQDLKYLFHKSGMALVCYGFGRGENRIDMAFREALDSPLLKDKNIYETKKILLYLSFKPELHIQIEELQQPLVAFIDRFEKHINLTWGFGNDSSLEEGQEVKCTIITTGFEFNEILDT